MRLQDGQWVYWPMGQQIPDELTVFEGPWSCRKSVGKIDRASVLAHCRWSAFKQPTWENVKRGGKWIDVKVAGDYDAFADDCKDGDQ